MSDLARLGACAAISIVAHFVLTEGLRSLPPHRDDVPPEKITIRVVTPPPPEPPPEPPKPPEVAPQPQPVVTPKVAQVTPHPRAQKPPPPQAPVVSQEEAPGPRGMGAGTGAQHFGVSMSSTSQGGSGPVMPVGNGGAGPVAANPPPSEKPAGGGGGGPVPDYEATQKPLPQGRCTGKFTDEAKKAGIEGTVELDVTVAADGRTSDIKLIHGLPHGLTDAAIAALRACRFTPGEVNGKPVAVRIHGFKISFYLQD